MRPLLPQQGDIEEDRWLRLTPILLTNPRIPVSPPPVPEDTPRKMNWAVDSEQKETESLGPFPKVRHCLCPRLRMCWLHGSDSMKDVWFCSQCCYHLSSFCKSWHPPPVPSSFSPSPNPHLQSNLPSLPISPATKGSPLVFHPRENAPTWVSRSPRDTPTEFNSNIC